MMFKQFWVDVETTGRDPKTCGIHEIACELRTPNHREFREWRVRPFEGAVFEEGWDVHPSISKEVVSAYECTEEQAWYEMTEWLGRYVNKFNAQDKAFFLGYNVQFDNSFLRQMFERAGDGFFGSFFWNPPMDVMPLLLMHLRTCRADLPDFKLETVYEFMTGKSLDAHSGKADIEATQEVFRLAYEVMTGQSFS